MHRKIKKVKKIVNIHRKYYKLFICDIFNIPPLVNIKFGAGAIGAGARSGSGVTKMMWFLAAPQ
jgi:hypothetical protein